MSKLQPGSNLIGYFAARGRTLTPDESLALLHVLLRLSELGAITAAAADECRGSSPKTPAHAGVPCADRGAGVGRGRCEAGALEGPTVYNMGPSNYSKAA